MPDIFLYAGEANPNDIRLSDPTVLRGGAANAGDGAGLMTAAVSAAVGLLLLVGTASATGKAQTSAASGSELNAATGAATATKATSAAAGQQVFTATAAASAANGATSATGRQVFIATSAVTAQVGSGAGAGREVFVGTNASVANPASSAGNGTEGEVSTDGIGAATATPGRSDGQGVLLIPYVPPFGLGTLAGDHIVASFIPRSPIIVSGVGVGMARKAFTRGEGNTRLYLNSRGSGLAKVASSAGAGRQNFDRLNEEIILILT